MADFIFDRDATTVITLRVPKRVWDAWEYRHGHYGKAIHALRETEIETMLHAVLVKGSWEDQGDPFYRGL